MPDSRVAQPPSAVLFFGELNSETIENPASNFSRLDGRDDFHTAATARALQHEKWAK
jgi:hypothetical protein